MVLFYFFSLQVFDLEAVALFCLYQTEFIIGRALYKPGLHAFLIRECLAMAEKKSFFNMVN